MNKTIFIEKSYIVASILNTKNKYLNSNFTTLEEVNYISTKIQQELNKEKIGAIILDSIDPNYFNVLETITINKDADLTLESIVAHYKGYLDLEILLLIWNEKMMLNYLKEFMVNQNKQQFDILDMHCSNEVVLNKTIK